MSLKRICLASLALVALGCISSAQGAIIATSKGLGADAELREEAPTTNRGSNNELATRIVDNHPLGGANDGSDRNSVMYLKFDITGETYPGQAYVRLTYRNTNMTTNRVQDTFTPLLENRTGLAFYGLHPNHSGNNWDESTITYLTAPGLIPDFNNGTKDYDTVDPDGGGPLVAPLIPLGTKLFPVVAPQNRLPVGGELVFRSNQLDAFIADAFAAGNSTVTIVAGIMHDGKVPVNDWKNFNYLFNPKEMTTLNNDPGYDADVNDPNNPLGSPWSGASNAADANGFSPFSPQLGLIPEPGSFALLSLAGCALAAIRRRR